MTLMMATVVDDAELLFNQFDNRPSRTKQNNRRRTKKARRKQNNGGHRNNHDSNRIISLPLGFNHDYLEYEMRQKIKNHLDQGKPLKCHHVGCVEFETDFETLYQYNRHCHSNHARSPLHPSLQYIEDLSTKEFVVIERHWQTPKLEPRGNPWE